MLLLALLLLQGHGCSQDAVSPEPMLLDRVVAVVNDEAILVSDVERVLRLGLVEVGSGEGVAERYRRALDRLVEQSLRLQEVDRLGPPQVPPAEVDRQLEALRSRLGASGLERALAAVVMSESALRQLLLRQLQVLAFVEERLGPRIFVEIEEIEAYYVAVLRPRLEAENLAVPALGEVQEQLRALLRERELNREIERWTEELRRQADVVDHLDRVRAELPPIQGWRRLPDL